MLVLKRKNLVIGLLVVVLIIMGYLNFVYNQDSAPAVSPEKDVTAGKKDGISGKVTISDLENQGKVSDSKKVADQSQKNENADKKEDKKADTADGKSTGKKNQEASASVNTTFFRDYRFQREQDRNEEIEHINSIVKNPNSDPEMVKEAQAQLLEITSSKESELAIENLIKAKGFSDVAVILHHDNANVIVDKSELVPEEVAMILDIVKRESGKEAENIKIIPRVGTKD